MKHFLMCALLLLGINLAKAQTKHKDSEYRNHPYWIEMMKDPEANYFEVVKAYELFWKGKPQPLEEQDVLGTSEEAEDKHISRRELRERKKARDLQRLYGLECKKFAHWKMQVQPYVQEDGHILTSEEQLKLWEEQRRR